MPLSRTFVGLQINVEWISEPSVMYLARWCQKTSGSLRRLVRDVEITQSYFQDSEGLRTIRFFQLMAIVCLFFKPYLSSSVRSEKQRSKANTTSGFFSPFLLQFHSAHCLPGSELHVETIRKNKHRSSPCETPFTLKPELISVLYNKY